MRTLLNRGGLSLVLFEGEDGYQGLAVIHDRHQPVPRCRSYNPWIAGHANTVKRVVEGLAEGLGELLGEFFSVDAVYLGPGKGFLLGCHGLDVVEALTVILSNGVTLQPPLPVLGRRIARILENEEKTMLKNGRVMKTYSRFYSFSKVVEAAAAISSLEDCRLIEIRAGAKKERGPDLRVVSDTGREVYVEVTARRPSPRKLREITSKPIPLSEFLEKVIEIDLERLSDKLRGQRRQLQSSSCIVVTGWHTSIGMDLLSAIQGSTPQTVKRVEDLRGVCIYTSWTGREPEHTLLCIKVLEG